MFNLILKNIFLFCAMIVGYSDKMVKFAIILWFKLKSKVDIFAAYHLCYRLQRNDDILLRMRKPEISSWGILGNSHRFSTFSHFLQRVS